MENTVQAPSERAWAIISVPVESLTAHWREEAGNVILTLSDPEHWPSLNIHLTPVQAAQLGHQLIDAADGGERE